MFSFLALSDAVLMPALRTGDRGVISMVMSPSVEKAAVPDEILLHAADEVVDVLGRHLG